MRPKTTAQRSSLTVYSLITILLLNISPILVAETQEVAGRGGIVPLEDQAHLILQYGKSTYLQRNWLGSFYETPIIRGVAVGEVDAPVTVAIVNSFHADDDRMSAFLETIYPSLNTTYIEPGLVRLFTIPQATPSRLIVAVWCADDQGHGWDLTMRLYGRSSHSAEHSSNPNEYENWILDLADMLPIDRNKFYSCFSKRIKMFAKFKDQELLPERNPILGGDNNMPSPVIIIGKTGKDFIGGKKFSLISRNLNDQTKEILFQEIQQLIDKAFSE